MSEFTIPRGTVFFETIKPPERNGATRKTGGKKRKRALAETRVRFIRINLGKTGGFAITVTPMSHNAQVTGAAASSPRPVD